MLANISRERIDQLKEQIPSLINKDSARRLNTLARVLEGGSNCVALTVKGNKMLITSNDTSNSKKEFITNTMSLLNNIANGENIEQLQEGLQVVARTYITAHERWSGISLLDNGVTQEIVSIIAESALELMRTTKNRKQKWDVANKNVIKEILELNLQEAAEEDIEKIMQAFQTSGTRIIVDYNKLIVAVTKNKFDWVECIRDRKYEVIDNSKLSTKNNKPLHAEMFLIDFLLDNTPSEDLLKISYYIGISKLCCHNCIVSISSLNLYYEERGQKKIFFVWDTHNKNFEENWGIPLFLNNASVLRIYSMIKVLWEKYEKQTILGQASESEQEYNVEENYIILNAAKLLQNYSASAQEQKDVEMHYDDHDIG